MSVQSREPLAGQTKADVSEETAAAKPRRRPALRPPAALARLTASVAACALRYRQTDAPVRYAHHAGQISAIASTAA